MQLHKVACSSAFRNCGRRKRRSPACPDAHAPSSEYANVRHTAGKHSYSRDAREQSHVSPISRTPSHPRGGAGRPTERVMSSTRNADPLEVLGLSQEHRDLYTVVLRLHRATL